jgi:hypothetical protein
MARLAGGNLVDKLILSWRPRLGGMRGRICVERDPLAGEMTNGSEDEGACQA